MRKIAAQHAPWPPAGKFAQAVAVLRGPTLAGDDEHQPITPCVRVGEKGAQAQIGLFLIKAVKVETRVDLGLAGGDLPSLAAVEISQRGSRLRLCLGAPHVRWQPRLGGAPRG